MRGSLRALFAAILLLWSAGLAAAVESPRAPCGGLSPFPDYGASGKEPTIRVWAGDALGTPWTPPDCTSWSVKDGGVLVAAAGRFSYQGSADDLLARFGAISALTGLKYWSVTEGGWRTLITHATALAGPDGARPRHDFTAAEMRGGRDLYFAQADNRASGEVLYRMRIDNFGPNGFVVAIENVSAVRRLLLTLFNPGDLQSVHFLERKGPNEWAYYGMAWTGESLTSRFGVSEASYVNRATALYRHFTGQNRR